jgi:hypothetical protein
MGIDLVTTSLAYELATRKPEAHALIVRRASWAIHGTADAGPRLTARDLIDDDPTQAQLKHAARTAQGLVAMLSEFEPELTLASERPVEEAYFEQLSPEGLEFVLSVAHAIQRGAHIPKDITLHALRALVSASPHVPQRSEGPMSALLASSLDTLWLPSLMRHVWIGPFGALASLHQLRADVDMLPDLLFDYDETEPSLDGARQVVDAFVNMLEAAGDAHCVRMSG